MTRIPAYQWAGGLVVLLAMQTGCSQAQARMVSEPTEAPRPTAAADRTIWDGVYTAAQAERGQRVAQESCFSCHSAQEWSNPMFVNVWAGRSVRDMYENLRMTMPYDSPGRLSRDQYAEVVSYLFQLNSVPAGESQLPSDEAGLLGITITPRAQ